MTAASAAMLSQEKQPSLFRLEKKTLGDFYWAHADILRGIGVPPSTYDQRILAFMAIKLLIDNRKLKFTFEYNRRFGLSEEEYKRYKGATTQETFRNILRNLPAMGQDLQYFNQEARYNPGNETNILAYINHPQVFPFFSYIDELPNHYLEMVMDVYNEKADFSNYPKEKYKDLYETTVARMKTKFTGDLTGQHFTQKSIIHLMCEAALGQMRVNERIAIYDPTCGTGSMVMEAAYYFRKRMPQASIEVYGQEYNGQVWLLAKIFLEICSFDEHGRGIPNVIAYGNTLTRPAFARGINGEDSFDFIIANPPFGVDWKQDYDQVVKNMESVHPSFLVVKDKAKIVTPRKSDGQFLFMLQIISLMLQERERKKRAFAAVITSSTLVSTGSATSAEAKIRQKIFSQRLVKAVVEQPSGMFTNTDISSHIWFLDTQLSDTITILKTDNGERDLYAPHTAPQDKMRNAYRPDQIATIIHLLSQREDEKLIVKQIPHHGRYEINISRELGKKEVIEHKSLNDLEDEIHQILRELTRDL